MDARTDLPISPTSTRPAAELAHHLDALQRARDENDETNSTAQLRLHPSGRFLYAPNRGHDSIACFAVDADDGTLSLIQRVPTEPHTRGMDVAPSGPPASQSRTCTAACWPAPFLAWQ
eukprot:SAG22_NODE_322_length_12387_cov_50.101400_7_plen_118_part_00